MQVRDLLDSLSRLDPLDPQILTSICHTWPRKSLQRTQCPCGRYFWKRYYKAASFEDLAKKKEAVLDWAHSRPHSSLDFAVRLGLSLAQEIEGLPIQRLWRLEESLSFKDNFGLRDGKNLSRKSCSTQRKRFPV